MTNSLADNGKSNGVNFFSSGLRQKVDQLMDILWAGGVNNPMDSIEQISYLLFLRLLSEKDDVLASLDRKYFRIFSDKWARFAWGNFVTLTGDSLFNAARDAIESLHELPGLTDTGKLLFSRATLKIYDRPTLRAVIQGIHSLDLAAHEGHDLKGDMYEYLLSKLSLSGTNGQFRTPRHIIDLIVQLVNPQPGQRICDPACGTAGFLISAFTHILRQHTRPADLKRGLVDGTLLKAAQWKFLEEQAFTGFDNDANMVKIAILNLYLHQLEKASVSMMNPLTTGFGGAYPGQRFDVILANPPFSGKVQAESILSDLNYKLNTRATELLFLKWFIDHLAPHGRAGIVVPEGVVMGTDKASKVLRRLLIEENQLEAVASLPHSCFKPYASVATFILVFRKGGRTERVWMYQINSDGFSQDGVREPVDENDIPDLLQKWQERDHANYAAQDGKHGWITADKIASQDFELAPRCYLHRQRVTRDYPLVAIEEICTLEKGATPAARAEPGEYPLVTTAEELRCSASYQFDCEGVCIPLVSSTGHGHASIKRLTYINGKFAAATIVGVLRVKDESRLSARYLYYFLESHKDDLLVPLMKGAANVSLGLKKIGKVRIPLPPLSKQFDLVAELAKIESEIQETQVRIDGLRAMKLDALVRFKNAFLL
jgi:type I restriction-modification system DNA methylase subunit